MTDAPDCKPAVFLPSTTFPMRGDLPKREPDLLARWDRIDLWQRTVDTMRGRPRFVLHDGPIYSNGNLHIGHALNRILKDVLMRAHRMAAGEDAPYIPGWDTHGLPIEWKVEEEYRASGRDKDAVPVLQFRDECRRYSQHWLEAQTAEFKRLGVTCDWENRYATFDYGAEAAIAREKRALERRCARLPRIRCWTAAWWLVRCGPAAATTDSMPCCEYVDLVEAGIIDLTKVVRLALENAVSVASVLLLTEATLTELPEPKPETNRMMGEE